MGKFARRAYTGDHAHIPRVAWVLQTMLQVPEAQSEWPLFSPRPRSQPPFEFILTSSAVDIVESNTLVWFNKHWSTFNASRIRSLTLWDASNRVIPAIGMWSFARRVKSASSAVHPGQHVLYTKGEWAIYQADWLRAAAAGDEAKLASLQPPKDALSLTAGFPPPKISNKI